MGIAVTASDRATGVSLYTSPEVSDALDVDARLRETVGITVAGYSGI